MIALDRLASAGHVVEYTLSSCRLDLFLEPPFPDLEVLRLSSGVLACLLLVQRDRDAAAADEVEPSTRSESAPSAASRPPDTSAVVEGALPGVGESLLLEDGRAAREGSVLPGRRDGRFARRNAAWQAPRGCRIGWSVAGERTIVVWSFEDDVPRVLRLRLFLGGGRSRRGWNRNRRIGLKRLSRQGGRLGNRLLIAL